MSVSKLGPDFYAIHTRGRFGPAYCVDRRKAWLYRGGSLVHAVATLAAFWGLLRLLQRWDSNQSGLLAGGGALLMALGFVPAAEWWLRRQGAVVDWSIPCRPVGKWALWLGLAPFFLWIALYIAGAVHMGGMELGLIVLGWAAGGGIVVYAIYRSLGLLFGRSR